MGVISIRLEDELHEQVKLYAEQKGISVSDWVKEALRSHVGEAIEEAERVAYFSDPKNHASLLAGGFPLSDFPPQSQPTLPTPQPTLLPTPKVRDPYEGCTEEERAIAKVWDERAAKLRSGELVEEPIEPEPEDLITSKPPLSYGPSPLTEEERLQEKRGNWRKVLRTPT